MRDCFLALAKRIASNTLGLTNEKDKELLDKIYESCKLAMIADTNDSEIAYLVSEVKRIGAIEPKDAKEQRNRLFDYNKAREDLLEEFLKMYEQKRIIVIADNTIKKWWEEE